VGGLNGTLLHWDGTRWTPVDSGTPEHILVLTGTGPDDIWAGTYVFLSSLSTLVHYNGKYWSPMPRTPIVIIRGIFARARDDVWGVGPNDAKLHYEPGSL
jgi:hypothetical protein